MASLSVYLVAGSRVVGGPVHDRSDNIASLVLMFRVSEMDDKR